MRYDPSVAFLKTWQANTPLVELALKGPNLIAFMREYIWRNILPFVLGNVPEHCANMPLEFRRQFLDEDFRGNVAFLPDCVLDRPATSLLNNTTLVMSCHRSLLIAKLPVKSSVAYLL